MPLLGRMQLLTVCAGIAQGLNFSVVPRDPPVPQPLMQGRDNAPLHQSLEVQLRGAPPLLCLPHPFPPFHSPCQPPHSCCHCAQRTHAATTASRLSFSVASLLGPPARAELPTPVLGPVVMQRMRAATAGHLSPVKCSVCASACGRKGVHPGVLLLHAWLRGNDNGVLGFRFRVLGCVCNAQATWGTCCARSRGCSR